MEITKEQKLFQTVVQKAWEDVSFKQELIANPVTAIEKLTGKKVKLPKGKTLIVRDQTDASVVYINIPEEPNMDDMELTEEQLEIIAGGGEITPPVIIDSLVALDGIVPD
ncbi:NHLP leader peptide family RiPP precursor [Tenacibaculum ovolyticum]|uniref:NHLP leader peptide family RiPP precursor n=1 Tax=Tenacibaculum ovolyticum TaxID=104270 RepID=UPI0022F3CDFB|nr:NHLP leader peptide family RiPP precursor [Tenacibaculum ovolyticum]WBX76784.1 NHLP leader peptide family RiPP precursor [Tenacibaculum ovolyticum]